MPIASLVDLVACLRRLPLLEPAQLEQLAELQACFPDMRSLARELITRGWLTPYQINQLIQDRGPELVLGPYLLLERVGEGGMGQVFKARHLKLGRIVALKVLRKERMNRPDAIRRFQREVRAAAHAFNTMQGRLQKVIADRDQLVAAIAHDLRTPVTRLRLRADFMDDAEQRAHMIADLDEIAGMTQSILAFSSDNATPEARRLGPTNPWATASSGPMTARPRRRFMKMGLKVIKLLNSSITGSKWSRNRSTLSRQASVMSQPTPPTR